MASNKRLNATITIGGAISGSLRSAFGTTSKSLTEIGKGVQSLTQRQKELNRVIAEQEKLGGKGSALRIGYARQELDTIDRQVAALRRKQAVMQRISNAQAANVSRRAEIRGQMVDAVAIGATAAAPIVMAAKFETAMLGVAKQLNGARDSSGQLTAKYYDMAKSIQQLGRELPIATNDIAAMAAAGLRMNVPADQILEFVRRSAEMSTAFELPADELADNMGKIAGLYKIPIPAIGALGDAVNYLDDNAISKGGDIIDYLTRVGGVASAVKIGATEVAALGSTLLTLGERTETAGTATNAMMQKLAAADKGTKKFRGAMKELGLSTAEVQKGMQTDAMGTMLKVLDAVGKLPSDKRLGALVDLVGLEHSDTMAKLATNTGELRKQLALANSEAAKGSMSREFQARMQTTNAQWELMKNRVSELAVNIGSVLLPAVNSLMDVVGPVVSKMAEWAKENPRVTKAIVGTVVALATLKLGALVAGYAFTFVKGAALSAIGMFYRTTAAAAVLGTASTTAAAGPTLLGRALMMVGRAAIWMGRAFLLNPIGLAITAIAGGAYLIYKNWGGMTKYFGDMWKRIKGVFEVNFFSGLVQLWLESFQALGNGIIGIMKSIPLIGKAIKIQPLTFATDRADRIVPPGAKALPTPPAMASGRGGASGDWTDNSQTTFQITQMPGESTDQLARRISEYQEKQRKVRKRSLAYDGATP